MLGCSTGYICKYEIQCGKKKDDKQKNAILI